MKTVANKQQQRSLFLKRLYEKGYDEYHPCSMYEIGREIHWDDSTTDEIEDFLKNEGLIEYPSFGQVCITHKGKKEVEKGLIGSNLPGSEQTPLSNTNEDHIKELRRLKPLPIILFLLGIAIAIVSNIASSVLPLTVKPYLWISWPLLILLTIISILLMLKQ
jgi:hypothetical protein